MDNDNRNLVLSVILFIDNLLDGLQGFVMSIIKHSSGFAGNDAGYAMFIEIVGWFLWTCVGLLRLPFFLLKKIFFRVFSV